nr:hypothetical protein [Candidatus Sigynarchaeota archaeon]
MNNDFSLPFKTGEPAFDKLNVSKTLEEYGKDDTGTGGRYITYLFIKNQDNGNSELLGLFRYRKVKEDEFLEEIRKTGVTDDRIATLKREIVENYALVVYLSRIGVPEHLKLEGIGTVIASFFEFLLKRDRHNVVIFFKIIKGVEGFLTGPYITIGTGHDPLWGEYLMKYRAMFRWQHNGE